MASRTAYSTWTPQKPTLFDDHYLRNRSTLDIGVLGYIGIVQHEEHSSKVLSIPPGTPCINYKAKEGSSDEERNGHRIRTAVTRRNLQMQKFRKILFQNFKITRVQGTEMLLMP